LIKGQRISWLGHLERMEGNSRMSKKFFTQELAGGGGGEGEDPGKDGKKR
jgi:hypothetical protein